MTYTEDAGIRNIGIIAHVDAGKTTLSERILLNCGIISSPGEVSSGTTVMDYLPEERKRGITVGSACIQAAWKKVRINIVDTPGHVDFSSEVERTLAVIDGCVVVFSAVDGVEARSEMVWREADKNRLPRLVFINKLDRSEGEWDLVLRGIRDRLMATAVLVSAPVYQDETGLSLDPSPLGQLFGIINLLTGEFEIRTGCEAIDPESTEKIRGFGALRDKLWEALADADSEFMEAWVEGKVTEESSARALRRATASCALIPVFCGAAKLNLGVRFLLDSVAEFLPDPDLGLSLRRKAGLIPLSLKELAIINSRDDCLALVWKVVHTGSHRFAWLRILAGSLNFGDRLISGRDPALAGEVKLYRIDAEQVIAIERAARGDIVAITGPHFPCSDVLTKSGTSLLPRPFSDPLPVLSQTVEPASSSDYELLLQALLKKCDEDPSLRVEEDEATGSCLISGSGELHLQIVLESLERECGLHLRVQKPRVILRESLKTELSADIESPPPLCARLRLSLCPVQGLGTPTVELVSSLPAQLSASSLTESLSTILHSQSVTDWELMDVCVRILELNPVNGLISQEGVCRAFEMALGRALTQAKERGSLVLLEPVMRLELTCPEEVLGSLLKCLQLVCARVLDLEETEVVQLRRVLAEAPLPELLDFPTRLRSATAGRCEFFMTFARFAPVKL